MNKIIPIILLLILSAHYSLLQAEFGNALEQGARQQAMGEAFTGLADDGEAVFYNQAGLINLDKIEVVSMYSRQLSGLSGDLGINVNYLGYAQNLGSKYGSVSARWFYRGYTDGSVFSANENIFLLGYGRTLMDIPYLKMIPGFENNRYIQELSAGIGLKIMRWNIYDNDGMNHFAGESGVARWTTGLDLSFYYKFLDRFTIGAIGKDLVYLNGDEDDYEKPPYSGRLGGAWKYNPENMDDVVTMDVVREDRRYSLNLGSERYFDFKYAEAVDQIVARGGLVIGFDDYYAMALGFGYAVTNFGKRINLDSEGVFPFDFRFDYTLKMQMGEIDESPLNHTLQFNFFMPQSKNGKEGQREGIFIPAEKPQGFVSVEAETVEEVKVESELSVEEYLNKQATIKDGNCQIFAAPDDKSEIIFEGKAGSKGTIRDAAGGFFKVEFMAEGKGTIYGGWINKTKLSVSGMAAEEVIEEAPLDKPNEQLDKETIPEGSEQDEPGWFRRYFINPVKKLFGAGESEDEAAESDLVEEVAAEPADDEAQSLELDQEK